MVKIKLVVSEKINYSEHLKKYRNHIAVILQLDYAKMSRVQVEPQWVKQKELNSEYADHSMFYLFS
jgi:hypothetical protein